MSDKQFLKENVLLTKKNILLYNNELFEELTYLIANFCGQSFDATYFDIMKCPPEIIIYICGNIKDIYVQFDLQQIINKKIIINVVKEYSTNYDTMNGYNLITIGEVPINMYNVGIYFKNFFDSQKNYFDLITNEHNFQLLTESTKSDWALRKGIYLTNVEEKDDGVTV